MSKKITIKPRASHKKTGEVPTLTAMLSITECKKIVNKNGIFYTDKEVEIIRNFLYQIAEMQLESKQINNN